MVKKTCYSVSSRYDRQIIINLADENNFSQRDIEDCFSYIGKKEFEEVLARKILLKDEVNYVYGIGIVNIEREKVSKVGLINEFKLSWLEEKRAMFVVLIYILNYFKSDLLRHSGFLNVYGDYLKYNHWISISYDDFIGIVDLFTVSKGLENVEQEFSVIKESWQNYAKEFPELFWFKCKLSSNKNEVSYDWLLDRFYKDNLGVKDGVVTNNECKHDLVFSIFDFRMYQKNVAEVKLYILSLKKSWSQKKFRDSVVNKKVLNTYLSIESKRKLDMLAELKGMKINEVLEEMIDFYFNLER